MKNNKKQTTEKPKRDYSKSLGVLQLFVVVSVSYMAYVVILGTSGIAPKVMTAPALLWAVIQLVKKFTK